MEALNKALVALAALRWGFTDGIAAGGVVLSVSESDNCGDRTTSDVHCLVVLAQT